MGIFTNSIRKNLSLNDNFIATSIKKAVDVKKEYSAPLKNTETFSIKSYSPSPLSTSSFSRKKLKIATPQPLKFVFSKTAKPADVPFKTNTSKLTKIKPISPSEPISAQEIDHISQEMERDARRYSRRF